MFVKLKYPWFTFIDNFSTKFYVEDSKPTNLNDKLCYYSFDGYISLANLSTLTLRLVPSYSRLN